VPEDSDVETLRTYLGGAAVAGGKVKESGYTYWNSPNTGATNEAKFNLHGSGQRSALDGTFSGIKTLGDFWTTTSFTTEYAYHGYCNSSNANLYLAANLVPKKNGGGIRLIKTTTTLTNGQTGTYTGNDGKVYRTICIGTQEWLADNLAETKFRNGDYLHGYELGVYTPISNANWAALTTDGVCCYNDDTANI